MMHEDEPADDDDHALFRQLMRDVVPLKPSQRAHPAGRRVRPRARFTDAERSAAPPYRLELGADLFDVQPGDELAFRRAGVPESVLRRLRRGQYQVEAEIDLHGMVATDAATRLSQFVYDARASGLRCIRVIHGKGLRSGTRGPVLKNTVNALLRRCDPVLAFASARPVAGGTGATLVLLNRL